MKLVLKMLVSCEKNLKLKIPHEKSIDCSFCVELTGILRKQ